MSATRPRLSAGERRQAVLETACRVFVRSSYRGATTAEIAREAGITEPILYRHFGSKRDLYLACLDEAWRSFRELAERSLAEDPGRCLGAISDAYMQKRSRIRLVDLWIQALSEAPDDAAIAKAIRRQIREVHAFVADVIRRGQEAGALNPERDPVAEAWLFVAGGLLTTIDHRLGGLLGPDLERVRAARRAYMQASPAPAPGNATA
ncbi:MAG TPA: TetR/AcrR family transcriptional regulator [Gaiellaceae bacterium]|nr:TetR/AcrR family transcriptional regulator [Gaiellaceae bacterium]